MASSRLGSSLLPVRSTYWARRIRRTDFSSVPVVTSSTARIASVGTGPLPARSDVNRSVWTSATMA